MWYERREKVENHSSVLVGGLDKSDLLGHGVPMYKATSYQLYCYLLLLSIWALHFLGQYRFLEGFEKGRVDWMGDRVTYLW